MPTLFLSPSTQEKNQYVTGSGSEEYWMNRLADAMVPYLESCGIRYTRNTPDMTAGGSVRLANQGRYDFYLALHSNASGAGREGSNRGILAFYYPTSREGQRAAQILVNGLRTIYPLPDKVLTRPTTTLGEIRLSRFPTVLLELGYHDNPEDAEWMESSVPLVAENLVLSLTEFFDIPFIFPRAPGEAQVTTEGGRLRLRGKPSTGGEVLALIPNGSRVEVFGTYGQWSVVGYGDKVGYAASSYLR